LNGVFPITFVNGTLPLHVPAAADVAEASPRITSSAIALFTMLLLPSP
jgi:hypothetical protein